MRVTAGFIVREVAGETIAIPTGDAARELSGLIALNSSGKLLFELLSAGEQTEETLIQAILDNFDIDSATAQSDVAEFLDILRNAGVLIED